MSGCVIHIISLTRMLNKVRCLNNAALDVTQRNQYIVNNYKTYSAHTVRLKTAVKDAYTSDLKDWIRWINQRSGWTSETMNHTLFSAMMNPTLLIVTLVEPYVHTIRFEVY